MLSLVLLILVLLIIFLSIAFIINARWYRGSLEKLGVPIVETHWLLGSLQDLHKKIIQHEDIRRFKKFGPVYGVYEGRTPILHICDPDIIKSIMSTDYKSFAARAEIDLGHSISNEILDYLPSEKWKTVRQLFTPAFSTQKIKIISKDMSQIMDDHCQQWDKEMGENDRMKFDFRNRIVAILIDFTGQSFCGIKIEDRLNVDNIFCKLMKQILCEHVRYNFTYNLTLVFPFLKSILPPIFPIDGIDPFAQILKGLIANRITHGIKKNDVLEICMDMIRKSDTSDEYKRLGINENTALSQLIEQFFTNYDATGSGIAMLGLYLAKYPQVQDKVLREVDEIIGSKYRGQCTHESVGEMVYLTACLNEVLRLCPPFIRPERLCTENWEDPKTGLKIPKGQIVVFPLWAMHRNPEAYENPEEFIPERFLPENKDQLNPYAFSTFGHGPKNCIGMRLAYENSKMIMCRILRDYRLVERVGETEINFKLGTLFVFQYGPFYVDLVKKDKIIINLKILQKTEF